MKETIEASLDQVCRWVEEHDYKAYDPADGNLSFLHALTFRRPFLERVLQQVVWKVPFNIRPLLGIRPHQSTKGMGFMAWGYTLAHKRSGDERSRDRADYCFNWLMEHRSPRSGEYAWGNDFVFSSRGGRIPCHEPTIVWSGLIGQAFLDGYEVLGKREYLDVVSSICKWIRSVPRERTNSGICLSYVAGSQSSIHNSNMLGAALLARAARLTDNQADATLAKEAMEYSCSRQRPDGSWYYGEEPKHLWIDNFHTAYNLDCLKRYMENTGDEAYKDNIRRGYDFFKRSFFEADAAPRYYHDRLYPIDIQCASQAIDTFSYFSDYDVEAINMACRVSAWTIENMQSRDGHFYYRKLPFCKVRTPLFHWGQATMFKALTHLLLTMHENHSQL